MTVEHCRALLDRLSALYRLLDAHVQATRDHGLHDPAEVVHEILLDEDQSRIGSFRGQVPRVGESIWTDDGAWRVAHVAWHVRSMPHMSPVSQAVVFVRPRRNDSRPNVETR